MAREPCWHRLWRCGSHSPRKESRAKDDGEWSQSWRIKDTWHHFTKDREVCAPLPLLFMSTILRLFLHSGNGTFVTRSSTYVRKLT
jgi:hypothetical protein